MLSNENDINAKKKFINKYINILETKDKYELIKLLSFYNIKFNQISNGVYIEYTKLNNSVIDIIYNFINTHI
jgi:hypothetical protein